MTFQDYLNSVGRLTQNDLAYRKGIFNLLTKFYALDPEDSEKLDRIMKKYCW